MRNKKPWNWIVEKESTENEFQDDSYKVFSQKHTEN